MPALPFFRLPVLTLWTVVAASVFADMGAQAQDVSEAQIEKTIKVFQQAIYRSQQGDGQFPGASDKRNPGAGTVMGTLALLVSGESMQHPKIEKALAYLSTHPTTKTYSVGVLAHVWSYLPFASYLPYEDKLQQTCKQILAGKASGSRMWWGEYDLSKPSNARDDLSVMQYCVLGLWQGRKRGIAIDPNLWDGIAKHMLGRQNPDGGWSYYPRGRGHDESRETMTCAGMTILYVCQQERDRGKNKADPVITAALDRGQAWLEKHFTDGHLNPLPGYQMYGYERIGLAGGLRFIAGKDWYTFIASRIVKDGVPKNMMEDRAFKLMFLAGSKAPIWCNKLIIPGAHWRNRPNDIYFASYWLSNMTKGTLNWLAVDVNSTSDRWLNAPVAYLSTDSKIALDATQEKNIRAYVDHGGILVLNAENNEAASWARDFARKLYPQYKLGKPLSAGMLGDSFPNGVVPGVSAINNGARDLVVVIDGDFGMKWQAETKPNYDSKQWRFLYNLYRVASDRGKRVPRLISSFELPSRERSDARVKVVIPKYDGNSQPENKPYDIMDIYVGNRTGAKIEVDMDKPLAQLADSDASLAHIMGTDAVNFKPEEIKAIKAFAEKGGTVLIETVGGHSGKNGMFASSAKEALREAFGVDGRPAETHRLEKESPLVTGMDFKNMHDNTNVERVLWRQATVERGMKEHKLRVDAISIKGADGKMRDAVLFSDEDLTLGMNRIRTYGINGYEQDSAQHFMLNLLSQAFKDKH